MASIERTAYPRLTGRMSEARLQQAYSLSKDEKTLVLQSANGSSGRLTFAVLLKARQALGYFPSASEVPESIQRHLAEQLDLDAGTRLADAEHLRKSRSRYRLAIRAHLKCRLFADVGNDVMAPVIASAARTMSDPADLINVAIEALAKANIELPAFSTLDRLVGHIRQQVHDELYHAIARSLTPDDREQLDQLLRVADGEMVTPFAALKETPGPATLSHVRAWADRLAGLNAIIDPKPLLDGIPHTKVRQFAAEAKAYEASDLRDVTHPGKRHTLLVCFVEQAQTSTRDELAGMLLRRIRRTRGSAREELKDLQDQHRNIEERLIGVVGGVLDHARDAEDDAALGRQIRQLLAENGGVETVGQQYNAVSAFHNDNYLPLMWPAHAKHRSVLFRVLDLLNIRSATHDVSVLRALHTVREHRHSRRDFIPNDLDLSFAAARWRSFLTKRVDGMVVIDRRALEVCVFSYLGKGLESGDLYLEGSSEYADYRTQLLRLDACLDRLPDYCHQVGLPETGSALVSELRVQLSALADHVDAGFPANTELSIDTDGKPHLRRMRAVPPSDDFRAFEAAVRKRMPERHLLDILKNVHHWVPYTRHFGPASGSDPKLDDATRRYLFAIFGYGCNLGPNQTAHHAPETINRHTLRRINAQHVSADTLDAARTDVVNEYAQFDLPRLWGSGQAAIADGTHIELRENNLIGERHIRYGGYGGIAYHHISDTYVALFCNFIACGVWEAVYILDGLLENRSDIQPDTLHADTHGQSEPVFGLAHLLGIKLYPRMRNWNDVVFYRPEKSSTYRHIDALFGQVVDWAMIERHWPDMMQVVLSIQAGTVLPSMLLRKLGSHNRTNTLHKAFRELGRVIRTMFLLRYISETEFRLSIRAETTKVESFHSFMDWIGFGGPIVKSGDPVEQAKQLKYMDLVANAIMLQNVADLTGVVAELADAGHTITKEHVQRLSPYMREHIRRFGQYDLDMTALPPPLMSRELVVAA